MTVARNVLALTVAAVAALTSGTAAEARTGAHSERVHSRTKLATAASVRVARLEVERRGLQRQTIRLEVAGAPSGDTLTVFVADATGALAPVGTMRSHGRSGRASWVVRTARGDALPFGVSDVALLSGRAIEVRTSAGDVLVAGVLPTAAKATGISRRSKSLKQGLAVDPALVGVSARIVFRRGEHGRPDRFAIRVEGEAPALALEAWLIGTDGTAAKIGDLVENTSNGDDDGAVEHAGGDDDGGVSGDGTDDDGGSSGSGAAGDGGTGGDRHGGGKSASAPADSSVPATSEYEFDLDSTAVLPFGAASLADLAGLALEIRNAADGSVVASGTVPDTSAPGDESDDGTDDDSSGGDAQDD